jgi:hypothetical protein
MMLQSLAALFLSALPLTGAQRNRKHSKFDEVRKDLNSMLGFTTR